MSSVNIYSPLSVSPSENIYLVTKLEKWTFVSHEYISSTSFPTGMKNKIKPLN